MVQSAGTGEVQFLQSGYPANANFIYTASVWMRGTVGTHAILRIVEDVAPYAAIADAYTVPLTTSWQQYTVSGYVSSATGTSIMIAANSAGTIWVDDAVYSFGPGTFAPAGTAGPIPSTFFGIHVANYLQSVLSNPGFEPPFISAGQIPPISGPIAQNWYDNSSWANVQVVYSEDTNSPHSGTASQGVNVQSVTTGAVQLVQEITVIPGQNYTMTAWLRGQAGATVNLVLQDANTPYTYYGYTSATLTTSWQQFSVSGVVGDTGQVLLMFQATVPEVFSVDDVTFTGPTGQPVSGGVPWPTKPFGTLRLWDSLTAWTNLEPQKGVWNFAGLDTWVQTAQANGIKDIILTLGQSPAWASSDPSQVNYYGAGAPAPPQNIQDWNDYVQTVAERYKGKIRYFEIWNEPNDASYYSGSVSELALLTQNAYSVIKAVDPGNTVIASPPYSAGFLDVLLSAGIANYVDVIGYHAYSTPPEDTARQLANVYLVMAAHGISNMPLWETEGASGDNTTSATLAPEYLARKFLVDLAMGVQHFDWYTWGPATPFCVGTENNDRSLTVAANAYGYIHNWLSGGRINGASIDSAGTWQIAITTARGEHSLIVWNPNSTVQFQIPPLLQARIMQDIYGGTTYIPTSTVSVGSSPIILLGWGRTYF